MKNLLKSKLIILVGFLFVLAACDEFPYDPDVVNIEDLTFGLQPTPEADLAAVPTINAATYNGILPSSYFLATPPPGNQGSEGSCVGWATAYGLKSYHLTQHNGGNYSSTDGSLNFNNICSPEYVFNQIKVSCSSGSYFVNTGTYTGALDLIKAQGACTWQQMPYSSTNGCNTLPDATQTADAAKHKIVNYTRINDFTQMNLKTLLYNGFPVIIGASLDDGFMNANSSFVWERSIGGFTGNHAMLVMGYDNSKGAYKVLNSWGAAWGDSGYVWLDYDYFDDVVFEAYIAYPDETNIFVFDDLEIDIIDIFDIDDLVFDDIVIIPEIFIWYPSNGLVAYYPFNGNANEITGKSPDGVVQGATPTTDRFGNANAAYYFDGSDDRITVAKDEFTTTNQISVALWFRKGDVGSTDYFMMCSDFGMFTSNGNSGMAISLPSTNSAKGAYNQGEWNHLVGIYDGNTIRTYLNNQLVDTQQWAGTISDPQRDLTFGAFSAVNEFWQGEIDEVFIYNRALTASEVAQLYGN